MRAAYWLALAIVIGAVQTVSATTYVVRPDGSGDSPTIQAAINGAAAGDIIELADGWFLGAGNRDVNVNRSLTIRAQNGPSGDPRRV